MEETARHCRVVLTGWDGDALLNESPKPYFRLLFRQREFRDLLAGLFGYAISQRRIVPHGVRDWFKHLTGKRRERARQFPDWIDPVFEQRFGLRERWNRFHARKPKIRSIRPAAFADLSLISDLPNFFDFYDPGVTHRPIEYRHPLLDLRLVEYCLSLPPWPWCIAKRILRDAMRGQLPEPVLLRPKAPLAGFPYVELLQREESRWVDQFVAFPALNRYVVREKIPPLFRESDPASTWTNLRPISLNFWLQEARAPTGNSSKQEVSHEHQRREPTN